MRGAKDARLETLAVLFKACGFLACTALGMLLFTMLYVVIRLTWHLAFTARIHLTIRLSLGRHGH